MKKIIVMIMMLATSMACFANKKLAEKELESGLYKLVVAEDDKAGASLELYDLTNGIAYIILGNKQMCLRVYSETSGFYDIFDLKNDVLNNETGFYSTVVDNKVQTFIFWEVGLENKKSEVTVDTSDFDNSYIDALVEKVFTKVMNALNIGD